MTFNRYLLVLFSILAISCKATEIKAGNASISCMPTVSSGGILPQGAIVLGMLPASGLKLTSASLITKSGSNLDNRSWDDETLYFEETPEGLIAEAGLDSTIEDPYLRCSYQGKFDTKKQRYIGIEVLLPIRPHVQGACTFKNTETEYSAVCSYSGK